MVLGDLTGFEPATPRVTGEVSVLFTTGWFWMTGNRRCADSPFREKWCAARGKPPTRLPPWRRKRHLHHRQTLQFQMCFWSSWKPCGRSGEQARSETLQALSSHPARALPLSYGSPTLKDWRSGRIRTCDPVIKRCNRSLHHRSGIEARGTVEDGKTAGNARPLPFRRSPNPRRNVPREDASTVRTSRRRFEIGSFGAKYPSSSPPQLASRGTDGAALFFHEERRAFTTWNRQTLLQVSSSGTPKGPETKNPSGASLGRGSGNRTGRGLSPFRLRETARACYRTRHTTRRCSASH